MRVNDESRRLSSQDGEQSIWGNESEQHIHLDPDRKTKIERTSEFDGTERLSIPGGNCAGRSRSEEQFSQPDSSGGIRSQLKELFELFLEYVHAHRERLEARLSENTSFEDRLVQAYERLDNRLSQLAEQDDKKE